MNLEQIRLPRRVAGREVRPPHRPGGRRRDRAGAHGVSAEAAVDRIERAHERLAFLWVARGEHIRHRQIGGAVEIEEKNAGLGVAESQADLKEAA